MLQPLRATHRMADGLPGVASNHELPQLGNGLQVSVRQSFAMPPRQGHLLYDVSPTDHVVLLPAPKLEFCLLRRHSQYEYVGPGAGHN